MCVGVSVVVVVVVQKGKGLDAAFPTRLNVPACALDTAEHVPFAVEEFPWFNFFLCNRK